MSVVSVCDMCNKRINNENKHFVLILKKSNQSSGFGSCVDNDEFSKTIDICHKCYDRIVSAIIPRR